MTSVVIASMRQFPPRRIVCLTEETVETLYLLGEQDRIDGLFGQADDPAGWELAHWEDMPNSRRHVTAAITSEVIAWFTGTVHSV